MMSRMRKKVFFILVERLGEEVCQIVHCVHVGHRDLQIFDTLANEEVAALYMLHALVVLQILL